MTHQEVPHFQQIVQEVPYDKAPLETVVIDTGTTIEQAMPQYYAPGPALMQYPTQVEVPVVSTIREVVNPVENENVPVVLHHPVPAPQQEIRPYEVVEEVNAPPEVIQTPVVV